MYSIMIYETATELITAAKNKELPPSTTIVFDGEQVRLSGENSRSIDVANKVTKSEVIHAMAFAMEIIVHIT